MDNYKLMFEKEQPLYDVLYDLLKDHTTDKNIVWATDTYEEYGYAYHKEQQMFPDFQLNLLCDGIMLPRIQKTQKDQKARTKKKAEVFTPSWVCNKMNNYCDEDWFGRKNVFNIENENHTWTYNDVKIKFENKKDWQKYVNSKRIEITCGEAPFLVSRYDTTTGEDISIIKRIGILDRKLRIVNENVDNEKDWLIWTKKAFKSVYGFEYQGDNLFFARVNLVMTFIEYYENRFNKKPTKKDIKEIAQIVSWNLWQMDGLKDTTPFGIPEDFIREVSLFPKVEELEKTSVYCKIKDWDKRSNNVLEYRTLKGND